MAARVFNLREREDMRKRLEAIDVPEHTKQKLYPMLLKHAGDRKVSTGVVILIELALHDYCEDMPEMNSLMQMYVPMFIDAMTPDEEAAKEAKEFLEMAKSGALRKKAS